MSTLTDRYVTAATRWLAKDEARALELELRERIADTMDAKGPGPDVERDTLEELGDPMRVAATYRDRPTWLIGPQYYFAWLRLVVLVLAVVPPIVAVVVAITSAIDGDGIGTIIGATIGGTVTAALHVVFWTTLSFALIERFATESPLEDWTVDDLPEAGQPQQGEALIDLMFSLGFTAIFLGALVWQHVSSPISDDDGPIPLVDPGAWWPWLVLPVATLVIEGIVHVWIHRHQWTIPLAWANVVFNAAFSIPVGWLVAEHRLINPELVTHLGWSDSVQRTIAVITIVSIIAVALWDCVDGFRKARGARS